MAELKLEHDLEKRPRTSSKGSKQRVHTRWGNIKEASPPAAASESEWRVKMKPER